MIAQRLLEVCSAWIMQSDALQDLRYGGSGNAIPTVAINAAGGLFFAALFTADQRAADTRISRRDKVPASLTALLHS